MLKFVLNTHKINTRVVNRNKRYYLGNHLQVVLSSKQEMLLNYTHVTKQDVIDCQTKIINEILIMYRDVITVKI